jgi:hypothetical protein
MRLSSGSALLGLELPGGSQMQSWKVSNRLGQFAWVRRPHHDKGYSPVQAITFHAE